MIRMKTCTNSSSETIHRCRREAIKMLCKRIQAAMESLISGARCPSQQTTCDCAMLGAVCRALASRKLDHWYSRKMEGIETTTTLSPVQFSNLLSVIRSEAVDDAGMSMGRGKRMHVDCSPWKREDEKV